MAGGQSQRMGQDKALLPWQGIPLLRRVGRVAADCSDRVYILTPWPDRYGHLCDPGWQFLLETVSGQGPLVALQQGLVQIDSDWVLLLACDLPRLQPAVLQQWRSQLGDLPAEILAAVPYLDDRWEPLCGFYHRQCLKQLDPFIAAGGRSFQTWLTQIPVQPLFLSLERSQMLWNCNTPADLV